MNCGQEYTPLELAEKAERFREYFGKDGGVTLSGGEPLLQPEFAKEFFRICKEKGLNTCMDTSGNILNDSVKELLLYTDRVLLDIKYTNEEDYKNYVGCSYGKPLEFLEYLNQKNIPVTLRQVIIPTKNDNEENILKLKEILNKYPCIDKTELLPFKKICTVKYDKMGIKFPFGELPTPTKQEMLNLEELLMK
jgi:pyruvate formate lyase activating enzyme